MPPTPTPHDALFRAAFGAPEHARGLLHAVLPAEVSAMVDWTTLASDPASYVDEDLRQRFSDLLFTARPRGRSRTRVLLYLLFEHQSVVDPDMPLRMFGYMGRIWERYRVRKPRGPRPPIVPVVLAHAPGGWREPRTFEALFPSDVMRVPGFAALVPKFTLIVEDLSHLSNAELQARSLAAFQLEFATQEAHATSHGMRAFYQLVRYVWAVAGELRFHEFHATMLKHVPASEELIMTIEEELMEKGMEQGMEKGIQTERRAMLGKLLAIRFGPLDPAVEARIAAASLVDLDRYVERFVFASTIDEVFAER